VFIERCLSRKFTNFVYMIVGKWLVTVDWWMEAGEERRTLILFGTESMEIRSWKCW